MAIPFVAGAVLTAADLNSIVPDGVSTWVTWTPTFTQSATITKTNSSRYCRVGKIVCAEIYLSATSAGTAANAVRVTLPVSAATGIGGTIGTFRLSDTGTAFYCGAVVLQAAGTVEFYISSGTAAAGATGGIFTAAIASGDNLTAQLLYESV